MNSLIRLNNLSKSFTTNKKITVLNKINYKFKKGSIYSLVGPSGSGKSTLLSSVMREIIETRDGKILTYESPIEFVYDKVSNGWKTIEYQFKPRYGEPGFMSVAHTRAEGVDNWGKNKKIKVTSQMKKEMIKTLQDAIKSKYKGSQETDMLLRNNLRLHSVLSWVKKLK